MNLDQPEDALLKDIHDKYVDRQLSNIVLAMIQSDIEQIEHEFKARGRARHFMLEPGFPVKAYQYLHSLTCRGD